MNMSEMFNADFSKSVLKPFNKKGELLRNGEVSSIEATILPKGIIYTTYPIKRDDVLVFSNTKYKILKAVQTPADSLYQAKFQKI